MKTKILLFYGYLVPPITSILFSLLPWLIGGIKYEDIALFFVNKTEMLVALIALIAAVAYPFQSSIISENDPHVLAVLKQSKVRDVFQTASAFQAVLILILTLVITVLSSQKTQTVFYGYIELLSLLMIIFESIALISNGRTYGDIRERIMSKVNNALLKRENNK